MESLKNILVSPGPNNGARLGVYDLLLLLGALFGLTLLLVIWAKYLRREKRPRRRSSSAKDHELVPVVKANEEEDEEEDEDGEPGTNHRRKFRKRRRDHRGRNPTLAETGGLPPLRDKNHGPSPQ